MPGALNSFLRFVSILIAIAMLVPCTEMLVRALRRNSRFQSSDPEGKSAKVCTRDGI